MRALGVTCYGLESVKAYLTEAKRKFSVYPDVKHELVVVTTVEELLIAYSTNKDKQFLVLDVPTHFIGIKLAFVGAKHVSSGAYVRVALKIPSTLPDFKFSTTSVVSRVTVQNVKRFLKRKAETVKLDNKTRKAKKGNTK